MPTTFPHEFDRRAAQYEQHAPVQREAAAWLAEWLPEKIESPALEVGAGTGLFTRHLEKGVLLRSRVLAACGPAADTTWTARLLADFHAAAQPLST
jgi:hypothetical protein